MKENGIRLATEAERMTSLEIAQVTGKMHKDVMRAIRNMEPAWEKVNGRIFALVAYTDSKGEQRPCYSLSKTECLYIATKFNDVARARLVLRWEELERERIENPDTPGSRITNSAEPQRLLVTEREILQQGDAIRRQQIAGENLPSDGCMTAGEVARMLEMEVKDLNKLLVAAGVQFWNGGRYKLTQEYDGRGLAQDRAFHYYSLEGEKKRRYYLVWTTEGAEMIRNLIEH
jgi:phage regulator Rha-like protein